MPLSREELLVAVEENPERLLELFSSFLSDAWFRRDAQMRSMFFGVPVAFFNGIAMARFTVENSDAFIEKAIAEMAAHGLPWSWQIAPSSTPFDLATRLFNHGMRFSHDMPLMVADLNQWQQVTPPKNYTTVVVDDMPTFERYIEIAQESFGLPKSVFDVFQKAQAGIGFADDAPVRNFLGCAGGEDVTCGTIFYSHGIGGIYTIGTPPIHRGKGYGTAITEACMAHAKQKGVDTAFLQASRMGFRVYQKIGFQEICKISIFVPIEP